MTPISTAGRNAAPRTPNASSNATRYQNHTSYNATQTARSSTAHNQSYPQGATRSSKVAVRFVYHVEPTAQGAVSSFRRLLAKLLHVNTLNNRANIQLRPVGANGGHISNVDDLGYSEDSLNAYIANLEKTSYASNSRLGPTTVYEYNGILHLQHDVPFRSIKRTILEWLKSTHIFLNQETAGFSLLPVAWVQGLNTKTGNIAQVADSITQECIDLYNGPSLVIPATVRDKHGRKLNRNGFLLQANVTHLSGRNARANVMQLSIKHETTQLAALLLAHISSKYTLVPSSVATEHREAAIINHNKSIGTELVAYIDNWTADLTAMNIPRYNQRNLREAVSTSKASNGERIFSHTNQSRASTVAIIVFPAHAKAAHDILQDLVSHAHKATTTNRARFILRTKGLNLQGNPANPPLRQSQWNQGPPRNSFTQFRPEEPTLQILPIPPHLSTVTASSSDPSTLSALTMDKLTATLDLKLGLQLDQKLSSFAETLSTTVLKGFETLHSSIANVNTEVKGLSTKVDNLATDAVDHRAITNVIENKVETLEDGFQELTQRLNSIQSGPAFTNQDLPQVVQEQCLLVTNSITSSLATSFKIMLADMKTETANKGEVPQTPKRPRSLTASPQDSALDTQKRKVHHQEAQLLSITQPARSTSPKNKRTTTREEDMALINQHIAEVENMEIPTLNTQPTPKDTSPKIPTTWEEATTPTADARFAARLDILNQPDKYDDNFEVSNSDEFFHQAGKTSDNAMLKPNCINLLVPSPPEKEPDAFDVSRGADFFSQAGKIADNATTLNCIDPQESLFDKVIEASNECSSPQRKGLGSTPNIIAPDSTVKGVMTRSQKQSELSLQIPNTAKAAGTQ